MKTNAELVRYLIDQGVLKNKSLIEAIRRIDRRDFVLECERDNAYQDYPLPIGHGQTISQPLTVAFMLELLNPQKGDKVLDVGSGCGRTTALLAEMVGLSGKVYGVEIIPELTEMGQTNLKKYQLNQAEIIQAGQEYGLPSKAPFDKILVSASADKIPDELLTQLKPGGTMVIPVKNSILRIRKNEDNTINTEEFPGFVFVPLIDPKTKQQTT